MSLRRPKALRGGASLLLNALLLNVRQESLSSNLLIFGPVTLLLEVHFVLHGKPVKVVLTLNRFERRRDSEPVHKDLRHSARLLVRERSCHLWWHSRL